jgi:hypothetical protein
MDIRSFELRYTCVYCGSLVMGAPEYFIHRDGFGEGPQVPLCCQCYSGDTPTCQQVWERIAKADKTPDRSLN